MWNSGLIFAADQAQQLVLDAVESDVDIHARLGSPSVPTVGIITIADTAAITKLTTGSMPSGSLLIITLAGYILGEGGNGGSGADNPADDIGTASPGLPGGTAFEMLCEVRLDCTDGYVWGGGGGGGGSGYAGGDGGDGGGGGVSGGSGGLGGSPSGADGTAATTGITAVPGTGADGGDGGNWGEPGAAGLSTGPGSQQIGAAGGNSGLSIDRNGFDLILLGDTEANLRAAGRILGAFD